MVRVSFQKKLKICLVVLYFTSVAILYTYYFRYIMGHNRDTLAEMLLSVSSTLRILDTFERRLQNTSYIQKETTYGRRLGFLKVHKTASTTTQSIVLRYGWNRNFTFILPPEFNPYKYPNIISMNESLTSSNVLPPPQGTSFDIVCHHVFYERKAWNQHLPENAPKIATIKEPFAYFRSALRYFQPGVVKSIESKQPLLTFLTNPSRYDNKDIRWSILNNRMSLEYGVSPKTIVKRNFTEFENYMYDVLDNDFVVVIVAEMFEESLIMVKRKLNWTMFDILFLRKNLRMRSRQSDIQVEPLELIQRLHKRFAVFDYMLYSYFKTRLLRQINDEVQFKEEVIHYKKVLNMTTKFCGRAGLTSFPLNLRLDLVLDKSKEFTRYVTIPASEWNSEFNITLQDCLIMYSDEIEFTQAIRKRQYGEALWDWNRPTH